MQPKHPWLLKCLLFLEKLPQIETTTTVEPFLGDTLADGLLTIYTPSHNVLKYIVEIKSSIHLENLDSIIEYFNHLRRNLKDGQRTMLITDKISDRVVTDLIKNNIEFIDTTGKIFINNSSVYILIKNNLPQKKESASFPRVTTSTLKVAFSLLQNPNILKDETNIQKIAFIAGVDAKTVKRSLDILYKLDYLQRQQGGKYRLPNYTKLLERWEIGYMEDLRTELLIDTFNPTSIDLSIIFDKIIDIGLSYAEKWFIGGELGAAILTNYLQPTSVVIYIPTSENHRILTTQLRLKQDVKGCIIICRQFGKINDYYRRLRHNSEAFVIDPLLIHAELSLYLDDRLKETAKRLYETYIAQREATTKRE